MNEATGIAKRIWLLLLKEGGRWSAAEIGAKLGGDGMAIAQNRCVDGVLRFRAQVRA